LVRKLSQLSTGTAIVTGASQGIGKSIATALAAEGVDTILASRSLEKLDAVREEIGDCAGNVRCMKVDLSDPSSISKFVSDVQSKMRNLSILVNCAGMYDRGSMQDSSAERLDEMFATNVRGTYALTTALLPLLKEASGDIVFINSTIVFSAARDSGQFAATQHALLSIANTIRDEVNDDGIRVLTVFPGRTATPRQKKIFESEGKEYVPDKLLQPADVAEMVLACLKLPVTAEVVDLHIRPRQK
jgi:short-subunit dehydrogenase